MNLIGCDRGDEMKKYQTSYHKLLEEFYRVNKIKINSEKTKLIMMKKNERNNNEQITFKTNVGEVIKEDNAICILGFVKNSRDSYDSQT